MSDAPALGFAYRREYETINACLFSTETADLHRFRKITTAEAEFGTVLALIKRKKRKAFQHMV